MPMERSAGGGSPCGACKFLRRKCVRGCVFAPFFSSEEGASQFAAVHKVFGASNVSKMLSNITDLSDRHDAVLSICFEAHSRLRDPVYGCVAHILALQYQVENLQNELTALHSQLASRISRRSSSSSAFQSQAVPSTTYNIQQLLASQNAYCNNYFSTPSTSNPSPPFAANTLPQLPPRQNRYESSSGISVSGDVSASDYNSSPEDYDAVLTRYVARSMEEDTDDTQLQTLAYAILQRKTV